VDAEFLTVVDGKVHLHKTNGVKIAVPIEKLSATDLEWIRKQPGNESLQLPSGSSSAPVPAAPPAGRPRPGAGASPATLAAASSALQNLSTTGNFVYNGFDWRDWMLKAGVSSGDAAVYATAFVKEKMDQSILGDIDRDSLRSLGVSEGDIIRIRKYASTAVASTGGNIIAERERLAQARNLALLNNIVS
jgi:hypothetical protein